jgi:serine/threonine protein kinase/tetratricopeptide (TPR) repeat protein
MSTDGADRNLLFGVLALQGDLIDSGQFAEACTAWAARKDRPLSEVLLDRGWISAEDRRLIERLLERKLRKHAGDAHRSLIAAAAGVSEVRDVVEGVRATIQDEDVRQSLADVPPATARPRTHEYLSTIDAPRENRDRYTLSTLHAQGGIGQVWLARDGSLDREVALKELRPDRAANEASRQRFLFEARITGQLDHPGVVPVYELAQGEAGGDSRRPYYTMRFIRGRTLSRAIADYHAKLAAKQARRGDLLALVQAFVAVCHTVAFAHSRGVIHPDLTGQNIDLGDFGEVILLDWGLAKLVDRPAATDGAEADFDPAATTPWVDPAAAGSDMTAAGQVLGTPVYMAPEQASGRADQVGRRTDVYGLGAILYEILAGRPPFDGDSTQEVLRKVREEAPVPPRQVCRSAPRALQAVALKAMAKAPGDRYATATDLAADVQRWLADEPVGAWREPWTFRARRWVSRNRTTVVAGVATLGVAAFALAVLLTMQARANRELGIALEKETTALGIASDESRAAEQALQAFYTGISEDVILRRPELAELRQRLLRAALSFYERRVRDLSDPWRAQERQSIAGVAAALDRIASIQAALGERDAAIQTRRRSIELLDSNTSVAPAVVINSLVNLGNLQRQAGKPEDAVRSFRDALDRLERAVPEDQQGSMQALIRADLGRLLHDTGRSDEARRMLEQAQDQQERLVRAAPSGRMSGYARGKLAATITTLGNIEEAEARWPEALGAYEKAVAIYEDLHRKLPNDTYYCVELARGLNNLGLAQATTGKMEEGLRNIERGRTLREALLADQPLNIEYRGDLARSHYHLARLEVLAGQPSEALREITKAEELYAGVPPKGPEDVYFQACMKAMRAGLTNEADREGRQRAADEAMALLKQAFAAGYWNVNRLKNDPPLAPLRDRPEFQDVLKPPTVSM